MSIVRPHPSGIDANTQYSAVSFSGLAVWYRGWSLLSRREKRLSFFVLGMMILAAASSTVMVAAIFPFLSIMANPDIIQENERLRLIHEYVGFSSRYEFLVATGLAVAVVVVVANVIQVLNLYVMARFFLMKIHSLSLRMLEVILNRPYEFHLQRHTGNMSRAVLDDAQQVVNLFFLPAGNLIASTLMIVSLLALLSVVEPFVTAASLVVIGGAYGAIYSVSRVYVDRLGRKRRVASGRRCVAVAEALGGIKDMKVLGREMFCLARFRDPSLVVARSQVGLRVASDSPRYLVQTVAFVGIIALCLVMIDQRSFRTGTGLNEIVPALGMLAVAGQRLLPEIQKVFAAAMQMRYAAAAVDSVCAHFETRTEAGPLPDAPSPLRLRRHLRLDSISYRYPGSSRPEIADIDLTIHAGERIGIVGETGAGKTTLIDIMLGLLRPQDGRLLVDDVEISGANMRSWQANIGYVPQTIFLTDASIAENIAVGLPRNGIDRESVEGAAQLAQIDTFIRGLPDGYETKVGERGVRLSGGQVQRIAIARALYRNPDLMVFDEATSALDTMIEREVMNAIDALSSEKTVVMIAHRLSTLRNCDRIAVMEGGRLVGFDRWSDLERSSAKFRRLSATA